MTPERVGPPGPGAYHERVRSNWLDLKACVFVFSGFCALGAWYGMAGGDDRITAVLFLAAFATLIAGLVWNLSLYAKGAPERRMRRREAQGRCPTCGYDLRDNQSGVCPECGTRIWT